MNKGLGRRPSFDPRSRNYPIRAMLPSAIKPRSYTWSCPVRIDQGLTSSCAGHAFAHEASSRPVKVPNLTHFDAMEVYRRALQLDEWEGEDDSGTSVLAAVKACVERGWYTGYRWAFGLNDLILAVGYKGPVVLGINWYDDMEHPDRNGRIHIGSGEPVGGHAIITNGVQVRDRFFKLRNSRNERWGLNGMADCTLSFDDMDRLLHEQGEACVPLGRKLPMLTRITGAIFNGLANV